jgi:hypothetical protein
MAYSSGIVGAEERDKLINEGMVIYQQIAKEHYEYCAHTYHPYNPKQTGPWPMLSEIYISLALYVRKNGIEESLDANR